MSVSIASPYSGDVLSPVDYITGLTRHYPFALSNVMSEGRESMSQQRRHDKTSF
jgi:hypothetical protein